MSNQQRPDPADFGLPELAPHGFDQEAEAQASASGFGLDQVGGTRRLFGLIDSVGEDETLRPWHGVWRFDYATNRASTAVVGLNLLLALAWRLWGWIKNGGLQVAGDPRQAFVDGLNAGHKAAVDELPQELQELRKMATGQMRVAESIMRRHRAVIQVRADLDAFLRELAANSMTERARVNTAITLRQMMDDALRDLEPQADMQSDMSGVNRVSTSAP